MCVTLKSECYEQYQGEARSYVLLVCFYVYILESMSALRTGLKRVNIKEMEASFMNFESCIFQHGELHNDNTTEKLKDSLYK